VEVGPSISVFVQVTFVNVGNRSITSPPRLSEKQKKAYEESVEYPADVEIKQISGDNPTKRFIGWWGKSGEVLGEVPNIPKHISLLYGNRAKNTL
jgi:hypothetical protein